MGSQGFESDEVVIGSKQIFGTMQIGCQYK